MYRTILIDPPWHQSLMGKRNRPRDPHIACALPYTTLSLDKLKQLPIKDISLPDCHLWLWTTNQTISQGFELISIWGFKYLAPIHWIKPSGCGNYFIHVTQTLLFAYKEKCRFEKARYIKNTIEALPGKHSTKPEKAYQLIESISQPERLELFARNHRNGWQSWGNEIEITVPEPLQKLLANALAM